MLFLCFRSVFQTQLWDWFLIFQRSADGRTFFELFSGFAAQALLFWSVVALLGTSPMGTGLICAAVFIKSAGAGALGAFFLQSFGMTGVGYFFLAIFPGKIPFFAALFLLFETANQTCARIRSALKGEGALAPDAVRRFAVRLGVSCALFLIGALTDCLTVTLFSGLFSLSFSAY